MADIARDFVAQDGVLRSPDDIGPLSGGFGIQILNQRIQTMRVVMNALGLTKERILLDTLLTSTLSPVTTVFRDGFVPTFRPEHRAEWNISYDPNKKFNKAAYLGPDTQNNRGPIYKDNNGEWKIDSQEIVARISKQEAEEELARKGRILEFDYTRIDFNSRLEATMHLQYRVEILDTESDSPQTFTFVSSELSGHAAAAVDEIPAVLHKLNDDARAMISAIVDSVEDGAVARVKNWASVVATSTGFARKASTTVPKSIVGWLKYISVDWLRSLTADREIFDLSNLEHRTLELRSVCNRLVPDWGPQEDNTEIKLKYFEVVTKIYDEVKVVDSSGRSDLLFPTASAAELLTLQGSEVPAATDPGTPRHRSTRAGAAKRTNGLDRAAKRTFCKRCRQRVLRCVWHAWRFRRAAGRFRRQRLVAKGRCNGLCTKSVRDIRNTPHSTNSLTKKRTIWQMN